MAQAVSDIFLVRNISVASNMCVVGHVLFLVFEYYIDFYSSIRQILHYDDLHPFL